MQSLGLQIARKLVQIQFRALLPARADCRVALGVDAEIALAQRRTA